ncbi:hypothetical protein N9M77_05855 [Planktomarina temperata]|nr:hypothetical protein [Planktomarina temperata]
MGHVYPEIDWIHRLFETGELKSDEKVLFVYPKNEILLGLKKILSSNNFEIVCNSPAHILLYLTAMAFPKVAVDVSHSGLNHGLIGRNGLSAELPFRDAFEIRQSNYADLRNKTKNSFPLLKNEFSNIFSKRLPKNYIVVQIKTLAINGTFQPTNASSLIPVLQEAKDEGFEIIFAGRETMPNEFISLGVTDYANSQDACSENDYYLLRGASYAICSASGFSYIPDILGIPTLQLNAYGITSIAGPKSLIVPSLLEVDCKPVSFSKQLELFYQMGQLRRGMQTPPNWKVIDASSDSILAAFAEIRHMVKLGREFQQSELQLSFRKIFKTQVPGLGACNYSDHFLMENRNRF